MTQNRTEASCRICLKLPKARSKFISVHNIYGHSKESHTFAELFRHTTGFHIEACEPQFLCTDCRLKLIKCFQFIQQCKKTQENLKNLNDFPQVASTSNQKTVLIYYEEQIFPNAAVCNEAYDDQKLRCNDGANEPAELIVEHDVPETTEAPCTLGNNEPDEQSSSCSDSRNETDEITIEEPKLSTNANDSETNGELIVEHVVAENIEAPDTHGIEEVSIAEPTISENNLKLKENEFVCILGPDPIEDVTESQDLKATDNHFACDQKLEDNSRIIVEHVIPQFLSPSSIESEDIIPDNTKTPTLPHTNCPSIQDSVIVNKMPEIEEISIAEPKMPENNLKAIECRIFELFVELESDPIEQITETPASHIPNESGRHDSNTIHITDEVEGMTIEESSNDLDCIEIISTKDSDKPMPERTESTNIETSTLPTTNTSSGQSTEIELVTVSDEATSENYPKPIENNSTDDNDASRNVIFSVGAIIENTITKSLQTIEKSMTCKLVQVVIPLEPIRNGYYCDYCKEKSNLFLSKSALLNHFSSHLPKSVCPYCKDAFTLDEINTHKAKCELLRAKSNHISQEKREFPCPHCKKGFTSNELDRHKAKCELNRKSENYLTCKLCKDSSFVFKHKVSLHKHIKRKHTNVNNVLCTDCGISFCSDYIDHHIEAVHKKQNKFICDQCPDRSFTVKQYLREHMNRTHLNKPRPRVCKICGEGSHDLSAHRRKMHTDLYPLLKCPQCDYKTPYQKHLVVHSKRHLGDTGKKHKCKTCGKKFVAKAQLNTHLASHSNQNSFICGICDQGFTASLYLKRHLHRVHLGEKKFECPVCHKKFQKNQDNRSHIEKHHPEYDLPPPGTVLKKNSKVKMSKVTRITNH